MRYLVLVLFVLGAPMSSAAQHRPSLPSIGLGLPPIGLSHSYPPWERKTTPWWERQGPPPWEGGHVAKPDRDRDGDRDRGRRGQRPLNPIFGYGYGYPVYVMEPYVVEVPQPPQVIYVEVPRREEPREEPAPEPPIAPPPAYVPPGDLTIYVIPGCYVGNVSPEGMKLPAGCEAGKVQIFKQ